ncbi:MAG TPA: hypothetical protein VFI05_07510 [Nitrospiraceae bacterium]|nr:hypothetical protein [Nitrospiraceae bacterium]
MFHGHESNIVRVSRMVPHDGRALLQEAKEQGWEGIVSKRADSPEVSSRLAQIKVVAPPRVCGRWLD